MKAIIHRADDRGHADFGWLKTSHSFSFGRYVDPDKMRFGALRVLNDDLVAPGAGFGTHPHDNMEIVTIPLSGVLRHGDSLEHERDLRPGEVQAMSAGTGLTHSEYNGSETEPVHFLQIWILPKERNAEPRYGQRAFPDLMGGDGFTLIASPDGESGSLPIRQDAWMLLGSLSAGTTGDVPLRRAGNGLYLFVIDGSLQIEDAVLEERDAMGITGETEVRLATETGTRILAIEVPMD